MNYKLYAFGGYFCLARDCGADGPYWNYRDNTWAHDAHRSWHKDKDFLIDEFNKLNYNALGDTEPEIMWG